MRILGIEIDKRTDILTLSAFFISTISITIQAWIGLMGFLQGPEITLHTPDRILFRYDIPEPIESQSATTVSHQQSNAPALYMRIGLLMAYTNAAPLGHNDVLLKERVKLTFRDGHIVRQDWQDHQAFQHRGEALLPLAAKSANPVVVPASSGISHDTYFFPFREHDNFKGGKSAEWKNFWEWKQFLAAITKNSDADVLIESHFSSGNIEKVRCTIRFDHSFRYGAKERGWHATTCHPSG